MSISALVAVRDYSIFKGSRYTLLLMIAEQVFDGYDGKDGAYISIDDLAYRSRIDRSVAQKYLRDLVAGGELVILTKDGDKSTYVIPMLEDEPGFAPENCPFRGEHHRCCGHHTPLEVRRSPARKPRKSFATRSNVATGSNSEAGGVATLLRGGSNVATPVLIEHTVYPVYSHTRAGARGNTPHTHKKDAPEAEPERDAPPPTPSPAAPPAAAPATPSTRPATGEKVGLWRDVQQLVPGYGVSRGQLQQFGSCHLYGVSRGVWRVYVARGVDPELFADRYGGPVTRALESLLHAGNQIVEFTR